MVACGLPEVTDDLADQAELHPELMESARCEPGFRTDWCEDELELLGAFRNSVARQLAAALGLAPQLVTLSQLERCLVAAGVKVDAANLSSALLARRVTGTRG